MQLTSGVEIPDGLLAAMSQLAENSRQGFGAWSGTVHQGFSVSISSTSLGIISPLYDTRTGCRYTGKERDAESGLDYFGARYMASSMGRFMSPDYSAYPDAVPFADFDNPQSLNLYSYVHNSPLTGADSDGHDVNVCASDGNGGQHCSLISNEQYQAGQQANNGGLNVPSLTNVGANGTSNITDSSGNTVGTATYVPNSGVDFYSNQGAYAQLSAANKVVNTAAAATGIVYGGIGAAIVGGPAVAAVARAGLQRLVVGATAPALVNLLNHLYQDGDEIPGGTAGAVRNEIMTGEYLNIPNHLTKADEMITALTKLIKSGTLSGSDQMIAGHVISDLKSSIGK